MRDLSGSPFQRRTSARWPVVALVLVLTVAAATPAGAGMITYWEDSANAQQWYTTSTSRTVDGGTEDLASVDPVYGVRVETTKVIPGYPGAQAVYAAQSVLSVTLTHANSTSSWSRCKWWFNPDPYTPGVLSAVCKSSVP